MPEALWVGGSTSVIDLVDRSRQGPSTNGHTAKHHNGVPLWEPRANGIGKVLGDAPLWEQPPLVNGHAKSHNGAPLWEPRPPLRDTTVIDVDRVVCLDGVPLWELRIDDQVDNRDGDRTGGLASHLESVGLPTPDEVEAPGSTTSGGLSLASVGRLAVRTYLGARSAAGDPRLTGVLRAAPSVASFIARSRVRSAGAAHDDTVVPVRATPGLALQAYLDEVLVAVLRHPELLPKASDCASAAADIQRLRDVFDREGWLERPATYHRDPPPPHDLEAWSEHRAGLGFEHVAFSSGWEPSPLEPGWARWMAHEANQTVHASVSRVPGRHHRSWLVCAHGLGMGNNPAMDLRAFRASQLARRGINVVVPVLPLHGPRASGRGRGEDLMTIDMVDSMHGVAQAAWDVRRIIRWLREEQGAEQVGVIGYSLGGLVASIVASLEDDLACVIAGIPVVDLPHLVRRHSPPDIARLADTSGVLGPSADEVHRVVSPLAMDCKVPFERRFIFAGLADRMSTFGHARRLWLHWDRPAFETYAGGHVGFFWSPAVKRFVDEALRRAYTNAAAA
ncbi:MAG TPA: alpha/beta fold hydrolase [Acidimicrobiales bacterium]|nr:alpha/beta fold hydrolase [Acidimicrobiales bacterium]